MNLFFHIRLESEVFILGTVIHWQFTQSSLPRLEVREMILLEVE